MNPQRKAVHDLIDQRERDAIDAVRGWIAQASFSDTGEGMEEAAVYTRNLLAQIADDAAIVPTTGYPMILGTVQSPQADAPTLMIYGLYDVTPLFEDEWNVDPLAGEIVDASVIGITSVTGKVLTGRGVNNHKGPVLASILAIKALQDAGETLPVNLIYVIEGEEEIGSPSMAGFVEAHRDLLSQAEGCWLPCTQRTSAGTMVLRRSFKGALFTDLECRGGEWGGTLDGRHIWAGHSAWIDAPAMQLVRGLSTLFDDEQRATIDGINDEIDYPITPDSPEVTELQQQFRDNPTWQHNLLTNMNVGRFIGGKTLADHLPYYMLGTTINIQGMSSGYQGPTFYTNMPGSANAKIDIRFTPGITHQRVAELVQEHLERRGYVGIAIKNWRGYDGKPELPQEDDMLLQAALETAKLYDVAVDVLPIANNCAPASLLTMLDKEIPFSIAGMGHGDRPHAPDEYITLESINQLMHWTIDYLDMWAAFIQDQRQHQAAETH